MGDNSISNAGYTIYKPTGVRHEFPHIDLVKQQVIGTVLYKEKTYMTVIVDLKADNLYVEGDVDKLGDLSIDKDSYIDMFKLLAPKKYYDELNKQSS